MCQHLPYMRESSVERRCPAGCGELAVQLRHVWVKNKYSSA